jgi:hypothetical protein
MPQLEIKVIIPRTVQMRNYSRYSINSFTHHIKIMLGDFNTKFRTEDTMKPAYRGPDLFSVAGTFHLMEVF